MALTELGAGRNFQRTQSAAVDASGLNSSDAFDVSTFNMGAFQVVWSNHSDTSVFKLEMSLDGGSNYDLISGSSQETSGASGSVTLLFNDHLPGGRIRLTVTATDANASARLNVYFIGKKGR